MLDQTPLNLRGENRGNRLGLTAAGQDFLKRTPRAQTLTPKTNRQGPMKLQGLCTTKDIVARVKQQPTEWKNVFISWTADRGLLPRVHKELEKKKKEKKTTPEHQGNNPTKR